MTESIAVIASPLPATKAPDAGETDARGTGEVEEVDARVTGEVEEVDATLMTREYNVRS